MISSTGSRYIALDHVRALAAFMVFTWHSGISGFVGRIGKYSYSIYLLHFFFVFSAAKFVNEHIMDISNFYLAYTWSAVAFLLMKPAGYLSFRFIEAPFLELRRPYTFPRSTATETDVFWSDKRNEPRKRSIAS